MTREKFEEIMNNEDDDFDYLLEKNDTFLGLQIIVKYLPKRGVEGARHDIIYSADVDEILKAGITEEDAKELRKLGWMIEEDVLAKFV